MLLGSGNLGDEDHSDQPESQDRQRTRLRHANQLIEERRIVGERESRIGRRREVTYEIVAKNRTGNQLIGRDIGEEHWIEAGDISRLNEAAEGAQVKRAVAWAGDAEEVAEIDRLAADHDGNVAVRKEDDLRDVASGANPDELVAAGHVEGEVLAERRHVELVGDVAVAIIA